MFYEIALPTWGSRNLFNLRKELNREDCMYYVYIHYINGKPIYIGKGTYSKSNKDTSQRCFMNCGRDYKIKEEINKIVIVDFYYDEEFTYTIEEQLTEELKMYATWFYYNKKSGNKITKEQKEKLLKTHIGTHLSDVTKEKLSLAFKGEKHPLYGKKGKENPKATKVIGIKSDGTDIIILEAIVEGKAIGFTPGNISNCCNGKNGTSKGYVWYFYADVFDLYFRVNEQR